MPVLQAFACRGMVTAGLIIGMAIYYEAFSYWQLVIGLWLLVDNYKWADTGKTNRYIAVSYQLSAPCYQLIYNYSFCFLLTADSFLNTAYYLLIKPIAKSQKLKALKLSKVWYRFKN